MSTEEGWLGLCLGVLGHSLASSAWVLTLLPVAGYGTVWALGMFMPSLGLRGYLEKALVAASPG